MSGFEVKVEKLRIFPHPNADLLELAQVGLFRAVVPKGVYKDGELALYIPEQAVLPDALIEELGLTGRLAGPAKNRVKAVRLRGELSQGIVCRPKGVPFEWGAMREVWEWAANAMPESEGPWTPESDFAEALGITKWIPPIPVGMAGEVESAPDLIRWIEIENVKRYPEVFTPGEMVVATEKIHGTCCLYTLAEDGREYVSSKGFGGKSLALKESETNLYWRAARQYRLREAALAAKEFYGVRAVGLFGEVYGKGVQDLHYGADASRNETLGYALFDAYLVPVEGEPFWLSEGYLGAFANRTGVPRAPLVYQGPYDYGLLAAFAEVKQSMLDPDTLREGVVVRSMAERRSGILGGRAILKFVSDAYLERKGGTEYE